MIIFIYVNIDLVKELSLHSENFLSNCRDKFHIIFFYSFHRSFTLFLQAGRMIPKQKTNIAFKTTSKRYIRKQPKNKPTIPNI